MPGITTKTPTHDCVTGRGVLSAGFAILAAVSAAQDGAGLSELARETGLAKATTHRLAMQLVALGALQQVGKRYYVGRRLVDLGRSWQPDPLLRRATQVPGRRLASLVRSPVAVVVLDGDCLRLIARFTSESVCTLPVPGHGVVCRAAAIPLLVAMAPEADPPTGYSLPEWRRVRPKIQAAGMVAINHSELVPAVGCAAAAVRLPCGRPSAAICAQSPSLSRSGSLPKLVSIAAREIETELLSAI